MRSLAAGRGFAPPACGPGSRSAAPSRAHGAGVHRASARQHVAPTASAASGAPAPRSSPREERRRHREHDRPGAGGAGSPRRSRRKYGHLGARIAPRSQVDRKRWRDAPRLRPPSSSPPDRGVEQAESAIGGGARPLAPFRRGLRHARARRRSSPRRDGPGRPRQISETPALARAVALAARADAGATTTSGAPVTWSADPTTRRSRSSFPRHRSAAGTWARRARATRRMARRGRASPAHEARREGVDAHHHCLEHGPREWQITITKTTSRAPATVRGAGVSAREGRAEAERARAACGLACNTASSSTPTAVAP